MELARIKGRNNLVRDLESGAILNTQVETSLSLKAVKEKKQKEKWQLEQNTNDINSIKQEVTEIKTMMKQLLGSISNG